ncbi:MAG: PQQ-binding-like beta-propeller repeat protein, partial [bacterium]
MFNVSPLRCFLAASLLLGTALTAFAGTAIGYRNDGSGVYPEAKPVTTFDDAKGTNILWKTPLPNYGSGCPIVVKDRVYVVCDATMAEALPALLCYDINTGKLLWKQEVNHLNEFPAEEAATARKQWLETRDYEAKRNVLFNKAREMTDKTGAEYAAIFTELKALGVAEKDMYDGTPEKKPRTTVDTRIGDGPAINALRGNLLKKYNLYFNTWQRWGSMNFGDSLPTPASDGENIYVEDAYNVVACYSAQDGAKKWVRIFTDSNSKKGLSWPGRNYFTSSPVLVGDVLVLSLGGYYRGIDKATGKSLWQFSGDPGGGEYRADTPRALHLGNIDVVIMPDRSVVRVSDGKVLATNIIGHNGPADMLIDGSTVISTTKEGLAAVTLTLDTPDTVTAKPLWTNTDTKDQRGNVSPVLQGGIVYSKGEQYTYVIDVLTGKTVTKVSYSINMGGLVIGGDYLFALDENGNVGVLKTGRDAKLVSKNVLLVDPAVGAKAEKCIRQSSGRGWNFTRSQPTFSGDKIIIRS